MSKKNIYLLVTLLGLFFIFLGTGMYFLFHSKQSETGVYNVDKYSDILNWCDTSTEENKLNIDCKALLLEIRTIDTNNSCADIQIITKEKELKSISVCESGSVISYSNDVLAYKKLMPIGIKFIYEKNKESNIFALNNISAVKIDDSYIQNIVNEDINTLINTKIDRELTESVGPENKKYLGADENTYTITNSIDFCPAPKSLPSYVTNKEDYAQFFNKNILSQTDYSDLSEEKQYGEIFKKLFACDSSVKLGYNICNMSKTVSASSLPSDFKNFDTNKIYWGTKVDLMSRVYLKQIAAIYNNIYVQKNIDTKYILGINKLLSDMYLKENLNETTFCSMYKIYDAFSKVDNTFENRKSFVKSTVISNLGKVTSQQCLSIFSESEIDLQGSYLKVYFNNINNKDIFRIYNQCNNLSRIID